MLNWLLGLLNKRQNELFQENKRLKERLNIYRQLVGRFTIYKTVTDTGIGLEIDTTNEKLKDSLIVAVCSVERPAEVLVTETLNRVLVYDDAIKLSRVVAVFKEHIRTREECSYDPNQFDYGGLTPKGVAFKGQPRLR